MSTMTGTLRINRRMAISLGYMEIRKRGYNKRRAFRPASSAALLFREYHFACECGTLGIRPRRADIDAIHVHPGTQVCRIDLRCGVARSLHADELPADKLSENIV